MTYEETQKIKHLRKVTSVMVEESSNGIECTKNRFGNRTMDGCKNVTFEKIELSKIDNDIHNIRKEYYELAAMKLFELNNMAIEIANTHKELKAYQLSLVSEMDHLNDMATNVKTMYSSSYTMSTIMRFNNALKDIDIKIKNQILKSDRI